METLPILRLDPDLADGIPLSRRALASRSCQARVVDVPRGSWTGEIEGADGSGFGLLVLSGVLCRRVVQGERAGAELLGPGDLLRPWDRGGEWSSLPTTVSWAVIEDARLAVLDAEFARRAGHFPEIASQLMSRMLIRSRYLTILIAIIGQRRVETRLTMLFWHLADRFGQVRGEWVEIPVPLTHDILGELVGARRPSVTSALSSLRENGVLLREDGGWRLRARRRPEREKGRQGARIE